MSSVALSFLFSLRRIYSVYNETTEGETDVVLIRGYSETGILFFQIRRIYNGYNERTRIQRLAYSQHRGNPCFSFLSKEEVINRREQFKNYIASNQTQKKIKDHIQAHKLEYSCLVTGLGVAVFTAVIMRGRHATLLKGVDGPARATVRPFNFFSKTGDIVTTVHNGARGNPGFRVHNFEHNLDFDTQGAAARAFGIPENVMSLHLNKRIPNANGWNFERIVT